MLSGKALNQQDELRGGAIGQADWLVPPRSTAAELIDQPGISDVHLRGNLRDLTRINHWLGGVWLTLRALKHFAPMSGAPLTVLDVATGGADIPRAIASWAARRQLRVCVLASDLSLPIVHVAAEQPHPAISFAAADGCRLPLADASVDVALCSFALHHLEPARALTMLREMARVARCGIVVNDVLRSWPAWHAARVLGPALSRNPLTRHDGPLSVLRAYTHAELLALMQQAGLDVIATYCLTGYRIALAARQRHG